MKNLTKLSPFFIFFLLLSLSLPIELCGCIRIEKDKISPQADSKNALKIIRKAYPQIKGKVIYDDEKKEWALTYNNHDGERKTLYWAKGKLLPAELLPVQEQYSSLFYPYPKEPRDPKTFTKEEVKMIHQFSSPTARRNSRTRSSHFLDSIYGCKTRQDTESNLMEIDFFDKTLKIHQMLEKKLLQIDKKIKKIAKKEIEIATFLKTLVSVEGYAWREIKDVSNRSFHSYGLAIDMLPKDWGEKIIYWNWARSAGYTDWMLIPLEKRWSPPEGVIEVFEDHGFIWGGKWGIWDNMHFEYRPELLLF